MTSFHRLGTVTALVLVLAGANRAQEKSPASEARERCLKLMEAGQAAEALPSCREALGPAADRALRLAAARAEFSEGDPEAAARLLEALLGEGGLSREEKVLYGRVLVRTGRTDDGEALLREALKAGPSAEAWRALLDLRLAVNGVAGAEEDLQGALQAFPADCGIRASAAALYAMLGKEGQAVAEVQAAERLGCPPLEWLRRPGMAERLDRPAFRALLRPEVLASGLAGLDDGEARLRLQLLEKAMGPEAIAPLEQDLLRRLDYGIRLREIHLLLSQREKSLPALDRLLREGDLMVRKLLLRQMALSPDPLRIPLLEAHLEREAAPGNRSLAALALAKAYGKAGRKAEAEALLRSIPEEDSLYPEARELLEGKSPAEK